MGIKRIVDTSFWTDGKVDEFSPEDKYFMLYLLTSPFTTQLGVFEMSVKQAAFQLGYSVDAVNVLLDRFENKYHLIKYSKETNEVAILNFLKHSVIKGGKPVEDCIKRDMKKVKNKSLIGCVFDKVIKYEGLNETVQKVITEYFNENEIDNDNDNDNERTHGVSGTYRPNYEIIKQSVIENKENGDKTCEWCGCKTTILHKHHYPIPKREGGTEIVNICSNCHMEFHAHEGKNPEKEIVKDVVDYLNQKARTSYRTGTRKTKDCIKARLNEGFDYEDFKIVIDKKCAEWLGDEKMEKYLRPETLFGPKFEGYLNAKVTKKLAIDESQNDLDDVF